MKKFLRRLVTSFLARCASSRLRNSRAQIIGITGSVGKTTTKDALAFILSSKFRVLANRKSFNSEIGLPLTLLEENTATQITDWFGIVYRAFFKRKLPLDADYVILEMGTDAPGDMDYLLSIVQPSIGIFIRVAPVHLARGQFDSLDAIATEKAKLIKHLPANGLAVLNHADERVWQFATETNAQVVSFGTGGEYAPEQITTTNQGLAFQLQNQNFQTAVVGRHHAELFSAVSAVAVKLGFTLAEISALFQNFHLEPGRLSVIPGIFGSTILDGSYNSNPTSARAALEALAEFKGRKIAVLGQMNELGTQSERYHRELGTELTGKVDFLVGVFGDARWICEEFDNSGKNMRFFETSIVAGEFLQDFLQKGDVVLFKGSQNNVRLEKAVAMVMQNPAQAKTLLCRQGAEWQNS